MAAIWKTVRVFISSTFRDMHAERDHLVKVVFPRLREGLEKHRIYLDDVDLRWGVTREQAESGHALDLCLHTIDECRPFFIGILGERYGSTPAYLPDETFASYGWVRDYTDRSLTELEIIHALLRDPGMKTRAFFYFRDPGALSDVPGSLRQEAYTQADPDKARKLADLKDRIRKSGHPVFDGYAARWNSDAYDRSTKARGRLGGLSVFGNRVHDELWDAIRTEFGLSDTPAETVINRFAEEHEGHERFMESRVRVYVGRETLNEALLNFAEGDEPYPCLLIGPSGSGKSAALARLVLDFRRRHPQTPVIAHFVGATSRSTSYRETLGRFTRELYESVLKEQKEARLALVSTEGDIALRQREGIEKEYAIPEDAAALASTLRRFLLKIPAERRVLIVLDAPDQLDMRSLNELFGWLPDPLPRQVRLIASTKSDRDAADIIFGLRPHRVLYVDPLTKQERAEIIRQVPSLSAKTLDKKQVRLLLDNPACANALFLRVTIEELRGSGSFDQLTQRILTFPGRKPGLFERVFRGPWFRSKTRNERVPFKDLFGQVLDRLETEFDAEVVQAALTPLLVARRGLAEREIRELVSDLSGAEDLFPILRQLRPYLRNNAGLLKLDYIDLEFAAADRYLYAEGKLNAAHSRLADYFGDQPYFLPDRVANTRKADELPWHLSGAERWQDLQQLLTSLAFCESKTEAGLVNDLADDFAITLSALPGEPPPPPAGDEPRSLVQRLGIPSDPFPMRPILRLLEEALRRDVPFLSRNPSALFQCLWNSCWWHDSEEGAHHYEPPQNGWGPDGPPWKPRFLPRTRREEPKLSSLLESWREERERDNPGFVWLRALRPLPRRLGIAERTLFHGAPVAAVACSPDGKWIATAGGYTVKVWDAKSGEERGSFKVGREGPDPDELIEKSFENSYVADSETERELAELQERLDAGSERAGCVAWSANSALLVVGAGQTFSVFDFYRSAQVLSFSVPNATEGYTSIPSAAFSPDNKRIVLAGASPVCALVVDAATGQTILELVGHKSVMRVSYSPEGSRLVTLGFEPTEEPTEPDGMPTYRYSACLWDATTGLELVRVLDAQFVEYSKDARRSIIATAAEIVVLDTLGNKEIARYRDFNVSLSPNQTEVELEAETSAFTLAGLHLETMSISPDGRRFASADGDGNVLVWDGDTGTRLACHSADRGDASATAFVPPNLAGIDVPGESVWLTNPKTVSRRLAEAMRLRLVCGFPDGTVHIWDAENAAHVPMLRRPEGHYHHNIISGIAFSPDGRFLGTAVSDLRVWDALSGRQLHRFDGSSFLAFDQEGRRVASKRRRPQEELQIWNVLDGRSLVSVPGHSAWINCAAFSPDGLRLATAGEDYMDEGSEFSFERPRAHNVRMLDLQSGKEIFCIRAHEGEVLSVAFSPDGRCVASGSDNDDDKALKLWDAETGELLAEFQFAPGWGIYVRDLAFSPDGHRIAFSSGAGLRMVDAKSGEPIRESWEVGDTAAWAAGTVRFPWHALRPLLGEDEAVVISAATGHKVAQLPARLDRIATHPDGRIFAGAIGRDVYLFVLEGEDSL